MVGLRREESRWCERVLRLVDFSQEVLIHVTLLDSAAGVCVFFRCMAYWIFGRDGTIWWACWLKWRICCIENVYLSKHNKYTQYSVLLVQSAQPANKCCTYVVYDACDET